MDGVVDGWDVGVEELLTNGDGGVTYSAESALTPDKHNYSVRERVASSLQYFSTVDLCMR